MSDPTGRDLLDEQMDLRLQEYGARWRDELPEPAPVALPASSPRRWLVPAAAAAAVALLLGVTYTVTMGKDEQGGPATSPSSTAGSGNDTCGPGDLVATNRLLRTAGNFAALSAHLELAPGADSCLVTGFPEVELLDHGAVADVRTTHAGEDPGGTHVIAEGEPAVVALIWTQGRDCLSIDNDLVRVTVGAGAEVTFEGFGPHCTSSGDLTDPLRVDPLGEVLPDNLPGVVKVTGTVTMDGGPAPGTSIRVTSGQVAFDGESASIGTSIDANGHYEIELPAGEYDVTVTTPQWNGGKPFRDGKYGVTGGATHHLEIHIPIR